MWPLARAGFNINSLPNLSPRTEWRRLPLGLLSELFSERESRERDGAGSDDIRRISLHCPHTALGSGYGRHWDIHGNTAKLTVRIVIKHFTKMLLFNLFGFLFYVAVGSAQIAFYRDEERPTTVRLGCNCQNNKIGSSYFQGKHLAFSMGAMSILTSFSFLVDVTWSTIDVLRK